MKRFQILILCVITSANMYSQNPGSWSGNLETNVNLFLIDSLIGPFNVPQYDNQLVGGEAWLNLNYTRDDLRVGIRFDMYENSNLKNPVESYSAEGIGRWFVKKSVGKLDFEVGYLYDQIGSGLIYRAYEQRTLFIDNAMKGLSAKYNISNDWYIKGFGGRRKNAFDVYEGFIKGISTERFFVFGTEKPVSIVPGIGFVNRTFSDNTMDGIVSILQSYLEEDRFSPTYNTYAATFYNTLSYMGLTWYLEAAVKSDDVFYDSMAKRKLINGEYVEGKYVRRSGSVLYSSVSLALGKLGLTLEGKRTKNFSFRVDPSLQLNRGLINYLPPMNRQNTYRLTSRYSPATQDVSEQAFQVDAQYKINKHWNVLVNFSTINTLENETLYNEIYTQFQYKKPGKIQVIGGVQVLEYNQDVYEGKPGVENVKAFVPFTDILYKFNRHNSLRMEIQYMDTKQDFGSWFYSLAEYSIAPHWQFEGSVMYNTNPKKELSNGIKEKILYPTLGVIYSSGANRYSLRYVKQVEGIVCSGGICRLEPAFNGVRFNMSSNF